MSYTGASHLPILVLAIQESTGPILELGCGNNSTPLIHMLGGNRPITSVEANFEYCQSLQHLATPTHEFVSSMDWQSRAWDVVLLDHGDRPGRGRDLETLYGMPNVKWIVVHDTNDDGYGYEPTLSKFTHRFDLKTWTPWTTVVSNTTPFDLYSG